MRRFGFSVLALASILTLACGDDSGLTSDGRDAVDDAGNTIAKGKDAGGKGKDGGTSTGANDGGAGPGPDKMLTPTSEPFSKDATGNAGLPDATIKVLKAGGSSCTAKVLYPYDDTVFPAGLTPPTIMWDGASDGAYIKLAYENLDTLDYQSAAAASDKGQLTIDPADWNQIVRRTQGGNLLITLNTKSGNAVSTCNLTWKIAQGAMTGAVFYNTYDSPDNSGEGAVVRLTLGEAQSEVYLTYQGQATSSGPCISCHSVSANGASLAASQHNYSIGAWSYGAASYAVTPTAQPTPVTQLPESTFGAFTPDGTRILSIGQPDCTNGSNSFPRSPNNFPLVKGPATAALIDTQSGTVVPSQGLDPGWFMWMPQFAPKGDKVAFNHAKMGADGRTDRRSLAVMDFDAGSNTFSNLRVLVQNEGPAPSLDYAPMAILGVDVPNAGNNCNTTVSSDVGAIPGGSCTGPCYPAWPFFTPDGEGIVYSMVSEPDFMSAFPGRDTPSQSELWYIDIDTMTKVRLDTANKGLADGDALANYYPTMLPVQVGGYYWLFWTSTRTWGNREIASTGGGITFPGLPAGIPGLPGTGSGASQNASKKRIWVSAIKPRTVNEAGEEAISDTSAPGFYLEGQSDSGNVRAFATLNPCQQNGSDCTSGLDCCTGYCNIPDGADKGSCVPEKSCSDVNEKCKEDTDCCPAPAGQQQRLCIANFCGFQAL